MTSLRPLPLVALLGLLPGISFADPCGMVPPAYVGDDVPLVRVGVQQTYVFHRDGIETLVIRPGFRGSVEEFGMLIPLPAVPALRKVSDNVFPHIAAAIDPPEVMVRIRRPGRARALRGLGGGLGGGGAVGGGSGLSLEPNEVVVEKEEAVGMYEVAVLRAGSAAVLDKWMEEHGYRYPDGMGSVCEEYIAEKWCFVAVKTKVGAKANVDPRPGMRKTNPDLPRNSTFDGHVQAMGFRFRTRRAVVPMRLSTFNEGDLRNVVYILSERPAGLVAIPRKYVVRQIPGETIWRNVTQPLPLRIVGGTLRDVSPEQRKSLPKRRNPEPYNGAARELFAADLLAVRSNRLALPHEETEKMLLRIGERLNLRGSEIDELNEAAVQAARAATVVEGLALLRGMTLSIVDGQFPREILANRNLQLSRYRMVARLNNAKRYDAKSLGPSPQPPPGVRIEGELSALVPPHDPIAAATPALRTGSRTPARAPWRTPATLLLLSSLAIVCVRRRRTSTGRQ